MITITEYTYVIEQGLLKFKSKYYHPHTYIPHNICQKVVDKTNIQTITYTYICLDVIEIKQFSKKSD